jgi:hypothetical protein
VSYKVFTHLLDQRGQLQGQHDGLPAAGQWQTTAWLPGQVVSDNHLLRLAAGAPAGAYTVQVGLYDPSSGQRLPASGQAEQAGSDYALLGPVVVR